MSVIYCVVPSQHVALVGPSLRDRFGDTAAIEVIPERRGDQPAPAEYVNQRKITVPRRVWQTPNTERCGVKFEQRLSWVNLSNADEAPEVLATLAAAGDPGASTELLWRWHALIDQQLGLLLKTTPAPPDLIADAFGRFLDAVTGQDGRGEATIDKLLDGAVRATADAQRSAPADAPAASVPLLRAVA